MECISSVREQYFTTGPAENCVDRAAIRIRQSGVLLAQPLQTLALIRKRLLNPGFAVDRKCHFDGTAVQLGRHSIADLERYRDDCLMAVQAAVRATKLKHGIALDE